MSRKRRRKRTPSQSSQQPQAQSRAVSSFEIGLLTLVWWIGLGVVAVASLQPWLNIGQAFATTIEIIPFQGVFRAIPLMAKPLQFLDNVGQNLISSIIGVCIAIAINYAQVQGGTNATARQWAVRVICGLLEVGVCIHYHAPYQGGIEAMLMDFPRLDAYMVDVSGLFKTVLNVVLFEVLFIFGWDYIQDLKRSQVKTQDQGNDSNNSETEPAGQAA